MTLKQISSHSLAIALSVLLCSVPQSFAGQTSAVSPQGTADQNSPNQTVTTNDQATPVQSSQPASAHPDPSQAPLAPVPTTTRPADNNNVPPDAPSEVQRSQQAPQEPTTTSEAQPVQQRPANPLGTATAQQGATRGGVASRPAGEAIAPAKQRQVRSLLIKVGLLAAGAAAVGTVVGLTRGTSSVPPGAAR